MRQVASSRKFAKKAGFKKIGGAGFHKKFGVIKKFGSAKAFKFGKAGGYGLAGGAAGAFGKCALFYGRYSSAQYL